VDKEHHRIELEEIFNVVLNQVSKSIHVILQLNLQTF